MASFPSSKVHRRNRRKLGRGQHVHLPVATVVITGSVDTATLTFSQAVVVNGPIELSVSGGLTVVSQTVISPTVVHILYSAAVSAKTYSFLSTNPVATYQGGSVAPAAGTF